MGQKEQPMHLTCAQKELSKHLATVCRVVPPRSTLPITGQVLLATDAGRLRLTATNLDLTITSWLPANVMMEGSVCLPARLFCDVVDALPSERVELDLSQRGRTVWVKGPPYDAKLNGIAAEEFPRIDPITTAPLLQVPASDLGRAIEGVIYAAAKDEVRPQLGGLLVRVGGATVTLVCSDGFRLAIRHLTLPNPATGEIDLIVPARAMAEVARAQSGLDESVALAVNAMRSQVLFRCESVQIVSRVIDGAYVNFGHVLDQVQRHTVRATLATAELLRAARFTAFVSRDAGNALRLDLAPANGEVGPGRVTLQATASQVGENTTELSAVVEGEAARIALDNTYLTDALDTIDTPQVILSASGGQTLAVRVQPAGRDDALHLISPLVLER